MPDPILPPAHAATQKARAAQSGDPSRIAAADSDLAASRIDSAITKALTASSAPLRRDAAEALAARIRGAAR